ncbi:MAG: hypothetical protein F4029_09910 [Gammaproteobacteria bacterium]|nr:hypothetical protein [Gammaproteobacteria bacterium]MYF31670.1 hypothetical protein [Gammaproteobacteria bacterium]MYK46534.1 hypothetical protein [Gammaproteobacteria bacterium]
MHAVRLAWILIVAGMAACQATESVEPVEASPPVQPVKSPNDEREYRYVVLPNNLRALLIHAPDSDRAAAAVSVARGSDHDPDAHPGLAHFVEHMLFIATEKYPEVDGFTEFVSKHGGSNNAYTAAGHTTYYFTIEPAYLPEAVDRLAQFFVAPRFDPDYVEREKRAVQAEYQLQLKQDSRRGNAVRKRMLNPVHPGSRFKIGSLETLADADVDEVRAFFEANYSADTITVALLGPDDLDALEALVGERFGSVVDRGLGTPVASPPLYDEASLPASYAWQTMKETRNLVVRFPIPPLRPHYRVKPAGFLASLIGHEGPGSLHDVLSTRGWIEGLSAGRYAVDDWNAEFRISLTLTELGARHVDEIVDLLYAWIDLVRRRGVQVWHYDEVARMQGLAFRFQEERSPTGAVISAAERLADYPPQDVLRAPYVMESFDESVIHQYLDHLDPGNSLVSLSGPDVEGDRVESVFGVPWRAGPGMWPRAVDAPLALPSPNPYLPQNLDLIAASGSPETPVRLQTGTAVETWHAPDTEFGTPRARVSLTLRPAEPFDADDVVLATLHAELTDDALNARAYPARLAGLGYGIGTQWTGFRLRVSGYNDKLPVLFNDVLEGFVGMEVDAGKFAIARRELQKGYANLSRERPYRQIADALSRLIHPHVLPTDALEAAATRATPETLAAWRKDRLTGMGATLFVHGNLHEAEARALAVNTQHRLGIVELPHEIPMARRMQGSRRFEHAVDHDDAVYALYIQGESEDIEERARVDLIGRMLSARYFKELRTERQLGYVVQAYPYAIARHAAIAFMVQASKASTTEVETLTKAFIEEQRAWFRSLSVADLDEYKSGYINVLTRADRNNAERASRLLGDLDRRVLTFDYNRQIADAVARLEPADIAETYERLIDPTRGNRLTVYSRGKPGMAPKDGIPIASIMAFKGGEDAP